LRSDPRKEPPAPAVGSKFGRRAFLRRCVSLAAICPLAQRFSETVAGAASSADAAGKGIVALPVKYPGSGATLQGYLARPSGTGAYPALIIHNIGQHCGQDSSALHLGREAARDYARAGFVTLMMDPLSRQGGIASFQSLAARRKAAAALSPAQIAADLDAARAFLESHPLVCPGRVRIASAC
jgi:hypothetical protein